MSRRGFFAALFGIPFAVCSKAPLRGPGPTRGVITVPMVFYSHRRLPAPSASLLAGITELD